MAKDIVMPALGMAQETGILLQWLKAPGDVVTQGEPLMEIETDKATVEIEAPASGVLANVRVKPGEEVPVGQVIAVILAPGEAVEEPGPQSSGAEVKTEPAASAVTASPVAARIAAEHNLDLSQIKPDGGRIQKADVLAYLEAKANGGQRPAVPAPVAATAGRVPEAGPGNGGQIPASPKARRLAAERGLDLAAIRGSGPDGAILAADVEAVVELPDLETEPAGPAIPSAAAATLQTLATSRSWRVAAERVTQSWTTVPHFYLVREVNASQLIAWRNEAQARVTVKLTYTDLLVKVVAAALRRHPRLNGMWQENNIVLNREVNIGLAVAIEDGLVVPVIHRADQLGLGQLAVQRQELIAKAQANKLSLDDLGGGTFTLSNLGMYGVDAFNAIINPPQAAILAVSRIAERVVPLNGQPAVQPMLTLTLSCDHRVVDGARGAEFLQTLAESIEKPLRLLD